MQNRICREMTFCAIDASGKGARPWIVYQFEISAVDNTDTLNPPNPNRAAAHNKSGSGT